MEQQTAAGGEQLNLKVKSQVIIVINSGRRRSLFQN
jgi:hypothetical protein